MALLLNKKIFGKLKDSNPYFVIGKNNANDIKIETISELEFFYSVYCLEYTKFPNKKWLNVAAELAMAQPNWENMIPKKEYEELLIGYVNDLIKQLKEKTTDKFWYFSKVIPVEKHVLSSFSHVCYADGTEKSPYQYRRTAVGRLVSDNNVNLFLMNQERREQTLESRFPDGNIISVDFRAVEPRVILSIQNPSSLENCQDVYETVAKLSGLEINRETIKLSLLKMLNGAALQNIREGTNMTLNEANALRESVFSLFGYREKVSELVHTKEKFGRIFNHFGRPHIVESTNENLLFTYFMQSTSADVCLIGFSKFIRLIEARKQSKNILPIAMIYDSLILDVRNGYEEEIPHILEESTKIKIGNERFSFPMSINKWNKGE